MRTTLPMALCLLAPGVAAAQAPAPPSVAAAEAGLERARQILLAAKAFEAAEGRRIAAEAEAGRLRQALAALQGAAPPAPVVAPPPPAAAPPAAPVVATAPAPAAIAAAQADVVTTTTVTPDKTVTEVKPYSPAGLADNQTGRQKFGGIDFGIGVAFSYDLGRDDRVKDASIVDGLVRVNHTENVRARLILESHYFFTPLLPFLPNYAGVDCAYLLADTDQHSDCVARRKNIGIGPFMALQPGTDNVIDAIGLGLMVGLRRREEKSASFNIGVGILYDVDSQVLGKGFTENAPPPGTETEVRFRRESQSGLLIMTSYSF